MLSPAHRSSLLLLLAALVLATSSAPFASAGALPWLAALVLLSFVLSQLLSSLRLPAAAGYLCAGLFLAGLSVGAGALIPPGVSSLFDAISPAALAAAGILLSQRFASTSFAAQSRSLLRLWALLILGILPACAAATFFLVRSEQASRLATSILPALSPHAPLLALLIAASAISVSPTLIATLLHERRQESQMAELLRLVSLLSHASILAILLAWLSPSSPLLLLSWAAATILLGFATGAAFIGLYRLLQHRALATGALLLLAIGPVAAWLGADVLLASLIAGVLVRARSPFAGHLDAELRWLAPPLLLFYIAGSLATLPQLLLQLAPLILSLAALRATLLYFGARWVTLDLQSEDPTLARLGACMIPQGVELLPLSLALLSALHLDALRPFLLTVLLGMASISWIVGASLVHIELVLSSSDAEPQDHLLDQPPSAIDDAWLKTPHIEDRWLFGRAQELRAATASLLQSQLLDELTRTRAAWLSFIEDAHAAAQSRLLDPNDDGRTRTLRRTRELHQLPAPIIGAQRLSSILDQLDAAERASVFRVELEPSFFSGHAADPPSRALIVLSRRLRKRLLGTIWRVVPVGELWTYHVALGVPFLLAQHGARLAAEEGSIWCELRLHLQRIKSLSTPPDDPAELPARQAALRAESQQLRSRVLRFERLFASTYQQVFAQQLLAFQHDLLIAGTSEHTLPAQVSRRVDAAFRARRAMTARRDRLARVVDGYRGWMLLEEEAAQLDLWSLRFETAILERWDLAFFNPIHAVLPAELPPPDLLATFQRLSDALRSAIDGAPRAFSASLHPRLQARIDQLPQRLLLHTRRADIPPSPALEGELRALSPRVWFRAQLSQPLDLRIGELETRGELLLRDAAQEVARCLRLLELESAPSPALLQRAHDTLALLQQRLTRERASLRESLPADIARLREQAISPVASSRSAGFARALTSDDASWLEARTLSTSARERIGAARQSLTPTLSLASDRLRALLDTAPPQPRASDPPALLAPAPLSATLPDSPPLRLYERLFLSPQSDVSDLYTHLPAAEAALRPQLTRWLAGEPATIALHGAPGSGRRSLIHSLLSDQPDVITIALTEQVRCDEPALLDALSGLLAEGERPHTLERWAERLALAERRRIVVLHNPERVADRSPEGFALAQRLLDALRATRHNTLWVLSFDTLAWELLDAALELRSLLPGAAALPPLDAAAIQAIILRRHQLSGLSLRWQDAAQGQQREAAQAAYFAALTARAQGNPALALQRWFYDATVRPEDPATIIIAPLPDDAPWWAARSPLQRLILRELLRHGAMDERALLTLFDLSPATLRAALTPLLDARLIERRADATTYTIPDALRPLAAASLS